jgi:2-C-methyl-D-erythritol 4-phosphate cytidylyltransferase
MLKVAVIIPAAGAGKRFGAAGNKIFQRMGDQPVFVRTLELFTSRDDVRDVQLVVSASDMDEIKARFGGHLGLLGVRLTRGGDTRAQSVKNALATVPAEAELVCVHDAVRPCVSPLWIDAVFAEAQRRGAAILALPIHATLKVVAGGGAADTAADAGSAADFFGLAKSKSARGGAPAILRTLPRHVDPADAGEELWEAQTPQVFRKDLLVRAYEGDLSRATDDAMLVEALGHTVRAVRGDPRNVKITTPADLAFAAAVLGTLPRPKPKGPAHPFEEARW